MLLPTAASVAFLLLHGAAADGVAPPPPSHVHPNLPTIAYQRISLRGQPKSGTTWLEVIMTTIVQTCCKVADGCSFVDHSGNLEGRTMEMNVTHAQGNEALRLTAQDPGRLVKVTREHKHWVPVVQLSQNVSINLDASAATLLGHHDCTANISTDIWTDACLRHVVRWPVHRHPASSSLERFVLLLRDPCAVAVSWLHWRGQKWLINKSESVLALVSREAAAISLRYVIHMRWTASTLPIFYEDLQEHPERWIPMLASYAGLEVGCSPQDVQHIRNKTSASAMHAAEKAGKLPGFNRAFGHRAKVRMASTDAWKKDVSADLASRMTDAMCAVLISVLRSKWCD